MSTVIKEEIWAVCPISGIRVSTVYPGVFQPEVRLCSAQRKCRKPTSCVCEPLEASVRSLHANVHNIRIRKRLNKNVLFGKAEETITAQSRCPKLKVYPHRVVICVGVIVQKSTVLYILHV